MLKVLYALCVLSCVCPLLTSAQLQRTKDPCENAHELERRERNKCYGEITVVTCILIRVLISSNS